MFQFASGFALLVLLMPAQASAKCAAPGPFTAPASGQTIPVSSHVLAYVPAYLDDRKQAGRSGITVIGGKASVSLRYHGDAYAVFALRIQSTAKQVKVSWKGKELAVYNVGASSVTKPTLGAISRSTDRWMCSFTDLHSIAIPKGQAIGYLVRIGSKDAPAHVVPPFANPSFYKKPPTEILIGHVNCTGYTAPASQEKTVYISSMHKDGSSNYIGQVFLPK